MARNKDRLTGKKILTPLENQVLEEIFKDPTASQQVIGERAMKAQGRISKAKPSSRVPAQRVQEILKRPAVRLTMRERMLKDPALREDALLGKLKEGLGAKATSYFQSYGKVRDKRVDVDYRTRYSYLDLATKIMGAQVTRQEITGAGGKDLIPPSQPALVALSKEQLLELLTAADENSNVPLAPSENDAPPPA